MDQGAWLRLDIAPHATRAVEIPVPQVLPEPGVEYFLEVGFRSPESEVAWEQF